VVVVVVVVVVMMMMMMMMMMMANLVTMTSATSHPRSADSVTFDIRQTRMRMGDHALSVAGLRAWNALPADIRCALSLDT